MAKPAALLCSNGYPRGLVPTSSDGNSFRHFNKHLALQLRTNVRLPIYRSSSLFISPNASNFSNLVFRPPKFRREYFFQPIRSSYSDNTTSNSENPIVSTLRNFSFESVKTTLSQLTPVDICKWCGVLAIAVAATKWVVNLLFNPFFWMYFSWTWIFWPSYVALGIAIYGTYCFRKYLRGEANVFEQLSVVTSAFTWLTLVPHAHFKGYFDGWPLVFFFVYHYFFFFNASVRKRLYGDWYPREHDPKWDVSVPNWYRILFCVGVVALHWLAAFEGPELHTVAGGWNKGIWVLIMATLFMQYNATLYLAKYSEKVVVPSGVVRFGPYRWVRHPIYASTMLLLLTYFIALRAPISSLFIVVVCTIYYDQKAKLEESLMVDTFGERYIEYMSKVRNTRFPHCSI